MFCGNCGKTIPDNVAFCPGCGTPVAKQETAQQNSLGGSEYVAAAEPAAPKTVFCPGCGQTVPAGSATCSCCGAPLTGVREARVRSGGTGSKKLWIILTAAVAAIAVVVVGLCCGWFSSKEPAEAVWDGAQKTVFADNFTADISNGSQTITVKAALDEDEDSVTMVAQNNGEMQAIYRNQMIESDSYYGDDYDVYDITGDIQMFFELYDEIEDGIDREEIEELVYRIFGTDPSKYINLDEVENYLNQVWDNFNDTKWLEENVGYSKDGDTHIFEVNLLKLINVLVADAAPVFNDAQMYESLRSQIRRVGSGMAAANLRIEVTIDGGELSMVRIAPSMMGLGEAMAITIRFYDIGSTEIDTGMLEQILAEASGY